MRFWNCFADFVKVSFDVLGEKFMNLVRWRNAEIFVDDNMAQLMGEDANPHVLDREENGVVTRGIEGDVVRAPAVFAGVNPLHIFAVGKQDHGELQIPRKHIKESLDPLDD